MAAGRMSAMEVEAPEPRQEEAENPGPNRTLVAVGGLLAISMIILFVTLVIPSMASAPAPPPDGAPRPTPQPIAPEPAPPGRAPAPPPSGGGPSAPEGDCPNGVGRGPMPTPKMYDKANEATIWTYYNEGGCTSASGCKMSDFEQLCHDTIERNKGDEFDFRLVYKDTVFDYITPMELPDQWESLELQYQRDTVLNALLARYGGVAMDVKTVLFHSLDKWWNKHMLDENLVFKGFYYTSRHEAATWFMMARREGLMRAAVTAQSMKSGNDPAGCEEQEKEKRLCYGSGMLSLALCRHWPKYCKCYMDRTKGCELKAWRDLDMVYEKDSYELENPRDSVQSPLMDGKHGMEAWKPLDSIEDNEAWETFKSRFDKGGGVMPFVTLQSPGEAAQKTKAEYLADQDSFFYQWLCLAGHADTDEDACGGSRRLAAVGSAPTPAPAMSASGSRPQFLSIISDSPARGAAFSVQGADAAVAGECARGAVSPPKMYDGKVKEQTIWSYHYDDQCKSSTECKLSDFMELCRDTIEQHKGDFDFRVVHKDEVFDYITEMELPDGWASLEPQYQKDTVVNALLARYGGVAMDLRTVMFHSLDKWWNDRMLDKNLAFKGFRYESRHETATWFMMARREGLLRAATTAQSLQAGNDPSGCAEQEKEKNLCYGSGMVGLALCRHYPEFCKCYMDRTKECDLKNWKGLEGVYEESAYELPKPRDSVQSPLEKDKHGEEAWKLLDSTADKPETWQIFKDRHEKGGEFMPFITLQSPGEAATKSRDELLEDPDSFFYQWLCLAGHEATDEDACGG